MPDNWKNLSSHEQQKFIKQEWDRRLNGLWFMNNGVATYITGTHYFYLNWWRLDVGYPDYRDTDRWFFLFWKANEENPSSFGMIEVTMRRQGKSFRAGCIIYEFTTRTKFAQGGLQSKTYEDCKSLFQRAVVSPWRNLPYFFQPKFDGASSNPKSELRFFAPSKKGKSTVGEEGLNLESELESSITCKPSVSHSYDGQKLARYVHDEVGKVIDTDVSETWAVVRFCLEVGGEIIGKALLTSTVEEFEKSGGKQCHEIWKDSFPDELDVRGRTKSGLVKYFMPAYYGYKFDEYGNSLVEESKAEQQIERDKLRDSPAKYASYVRKMPWTESEAFRINASQSLFDTELIYRQKDILEVDDPTVTGNFIWANPGEDTKVVWKPTKSKWRWRLSYLPPEEEENVVVFRNGGRYPGNTLKYTMGVDPYDHSQTTDNRKSNAAAYIFYKYNMFDEDNSNTFVAEYINRPAKVDIFYEDILMAAHFFGCDVLFENQKIGISHYFDRRGFEKYLMKRPDNTKTKYSQDQQTPGVPQSKMLLNLLTEHIERYVYDHSSKVPFDRLLSDWLEFDINNTTKFDPTIASGITLIAASRKVKVKKEIKNTQYFRTYNNKGDFSQRTS